MFQSPHPFRVAFAASLLLVAASAAQAQFQPVTCKNPETQEQEIEEGNGYVAQIYQAMPVLPDSDPVSQYVQQVGARLVAASPLTPGLTTQWPFHFHVVADGSINAFALPGGTMFVNLGAIQAAENESQLAGVMGHELSHVIMRHSTCKEASEKKKKVGFGLAALGAQTALGNRGGDVASDAANRGIGTLQSLTFLKMSRTDEQQADLLGVGISNRAGFDPRALPQFFEIITTKYGSGGHQFLSDHPNPGNRSEYVNAEIAKLPTSAAPVKTSTEFTRAHALAVKDDTFTAEQMKSGEWRSNSLYASHP